MTALNQEREAAARLTRAQKRIALGCGDIGDRFPCHLCGAPTPSHCGVSKANRQAVMEAIWASGSLGILQSHLKEQSAS